ncbi:MAG: helix-turn-helix transcriptional regulator [Clostridia bacterium]|nr:helix-turn-helix transcriptional regulator [Clostridia bacterium]
MEQNSLKISMKAARVNANLSQETVCKELHISKSTLISWEKGKSFPPISYFSKMCKLYKISQDCIILSDTLQKVE